MLDLIGAVALLLWGLRMVRTGVSRAFGARLRRWIGIGTRNRVSAFGVGLLITMALQSSTATALMTASFAGSGMRRSCARSGRRCAAGARQPQGHAGRAARDPRQFPHASCGVRAGLVDDHSAGKIPEAEAVRIAALVSSHPLVGEVELGQQICGEVVLVSVAMNIGKRYAFAFRQHVGIKPVVETKRIAFGAAHEGRFTNISSGARGAR